VTTAEGQGEAQEKTKLFSIWKQEAWNGEGSAMTVKEKRGNKTHRFAHQTKKGAMRMGNYNVLIPNSAEGPKTIRTV